MNEDKRVKICCIEKIGICNCEDVFSRVLVKHINLLDAI